MCKLTMSILAKWRQQGIFFRFLDNNTLNCRLDNIEKVELYEALMNIDTWTVDWDMELTEEEIELVKTPEWRAGLYKTM